MGWIYRIDRTRKGDVVVLKRNLFEIRIPRNMWNAVTQALNQEESGIRPESLRVRDSQD